jgi:hypothetical protein
VNISEYKVSATLKWILAGKDETIPAVPKEGAKATPGGEVPGPKLSTRLNVVSIFGTAGRVQFPLLRRLKQSKILQEM